MSVVSGSLTSTRMRSLTVTVQAGTTRPSTLTTHARHCAKVRVVFQITQGGDVHTRLGGDIDFGRIRA
jgi:hypothetical protein